MNLRPVLLSVLVAAASGPALAHHSFAMFDGSKMYIWEGTVLAYDWANPHIHIKVVIPPTSKDPKLVGEWDLEGASPSIQSRQGWTRVTYKPGDKIVVVGQPLRDGTNGGSIFYALKDGKRLYEDVQHNGGPGAGGRGIPPGIVLP